MYKRRACWQKQASPHDNPTRYCDNFMQPLANSCVIPSRFEPLTSYLCGKLYKHNQSELVSCLVRLLIFVFHLTHWGRETHTCVGKLTIIGLDNGLSPGRRQTLIWTNAGILLIGPLRINFNKMLIEIHILSFKKIHLKMSSAKWRPFCLGPNVLIRLDSDENGRL